MKWPWSMKTLDERTCEEVSTMLYLESTLYLDPEDVDNWPHLRINYLVGSIFLYGLVAATYLFIAARPGYAKAKALLRYLYATEQDFRAEYESLARFMAENYPEEKLKASADKHLRSLFRERVEAVVVWYLMQELDEDDKDLVGYTALLTADRMEALGDDKSLKKGWKLIDSLVKQKYSLADCRAEFKHLGAKRLAHGRESSSQGVKAK